LPELGNKDVSPEQLTALTELVPYSRDSGKKGGKRFIRGGRKIPRDGLFMTVLTGKHTINFLEKLFQRLNQIKPKKVTMVAAMRRLLLLFHNLLKNNRNFAIDYKI